MTNLHKATDNFMENNAGFITKMVKLSAGDLFWETNVFENSDSIVSIIVTDEGIQQSIFFKDSDLPENRTAIDVLEFRRKYELKDTEGWLCGEAELDDDGHYNICGDEGILFWDKKTQKYVVNRYGSTVRIPEFNELFNT